MGNVVVIQIFPRKILNQKDNHNNIFNFFGNHLFQNTKYPVVHYPTKKPMGLRKVSLPGAEKEVRVMTFHGVTAFGVPKFPTTMFEDFAWVTKGELGNYFEDEYFNQAAWAATAEF